MSNAVWSIWGDGLEPIETGLTWAEMKQKVDDGPGDWYGDNSDTGETYEP
ncbi:hypothetical protein LZ318_11800 [Saccharopolyspora indica]|nr:hypothetical protein [Saccharopolyspora indica]MDA3643805.1 hypothetical protein [Saccharopolyspora indica]